MCKARWVRKNAHPRVKVIANATTIKLSGRFMPRYSHSARQAHAETDRRAGGSGRIDPDKQSDRRSQTRQAVRRESVAPLPAQPLEAHRGPVHPTPAASGIGSAAATG